MRAGAESLDAALALDRKVLAFPGGSYEAFRPHEVLA